MRFFGLRIQFIAAQVAASAACFLDIDTSAEHGGIYADNSQSFEDKRRFVDAGAESSGQGPKLYSQVVRNSAMLGYASAVDERA